MKIAANRAFLRRAALAGAGALVLACAAPPAAPAADGCPNAEIRQQQGAAGLPECRAYEQVSPVRKNGNAVLAGYAPSPLGGAFAYLSNGAFAGSQSSIAANYVAHRTDDGWRTTAINPPMIGPRNPSLLDEVILATVSDDMTRAVQSTSFPVDPADAALTGADLYLRTPGGAHTWLSGTALPTAFPNAVAYQGASGDLRHIVFAAERALTPDVAAPVTDPQLYEWVEGALRLVNKDANGDPMPAGAVAGTASGQTSTTPFGRSPDAVSDDGRTIFFTSPPDTSNGRLYARVDAAMTIDVGLSQKQPPDPEPLRGTRFWDASPDGRHVVFTSMDGLTDSAPRVEIGSDANLYLYDVGSGVLANAAPYRNASAPPEEQAAGSQVTDGIGVADDGSRVYFRAKGRLIEGLPVITPVQRYVYRYDVPEDRVVLVGVVGSTEASNDETVALSPNGRYLMVETQQALDGGSGAGVVNLYAHDAVAGTTTCVTCAGGGLDKFEADAQEYREPVRPFNRVTDEGRVFFTSHTALVPEDVNGTADAYMWHAGGLHLISSGIDPAPSMFVGATPDAREVFFLTNESLVGHDIDNGVADVYVARVGGGLPEPVTPPDCGTECRQPSAGLQPAVMGSATLTPATQAALAPRPSVRVSRLSRAARARLARGRAINVKVRVNRAGTLRLIARARVAKRLRVVARDAERANKPGTERLRLRLSRAARARLRRGNALRMTVHVRFTGVREPERLAFTLRPAGDR